MSNCCSNKSFEKFGKIELENLDGFICYCFKKSKKDLFDDILIGKEKYFVDEIKTNINKLGCFCETTNPSGKCCLVDIQGFIKCIKEHGTY